MLWLGSTINYWTENFYIIDLEWTLKKIKPSSLYEPTNGKWFYFVFYAQPHAGYSRWAHRFPHVRAAVER